MKSLFAATLLESALVGVGSVVGMVLVIGGLVWVLMKDNSESPADKEVRKVIEKWRAGK